MNRVNVQQARDAMQRVINENRIFDMSEWTLRCDPEGGKTPFECGFAGCLWGTCWLDKRVVGFGQELNKASPGQKATCRVQLFATWLGLTWYSTDTLCEDEVFYGDKSLSFVTPVQVIEKLDELLDGSSPLLDS